LISYRPFRNNDTPQLVEIWRSQPVARGFAQPASVDLFEQIVLAKPYFENDGLILACDDRRALGFVHAGFGASEDAGTLNRRFGVTCLLLVRPENQQSDIGPGLLISSEAYLRSRGTEVLYAGGIRPLDPFYRGLYGGSEMPGVLTSDTFAHGVYRAAGYREVDRVIVLDRELAGFRVPMDRTQMQIRRTSVVQDNCDAPPRNWWEACALEHFQILSFELCERDNPRPVASARFWLLEPFAAGWGVQAAGLFDLQVAPERRRAGLASFLLGDAFRRLMAQGIGLVEVQTMAGNSAALGLYGKLGFREVEQGVAYRKENPSA
jgi:ribosomal protein S18 acetylase RimI-like enzyme